MGEITATEIAEYYADCLNMVNLINLGRPSAMSYLEWEGTIATSKEYLTNMMAENFWSNEDLSPLEKILEM